METKNNWIVVDESVGDMFCLAVREESTGRLIADLADHPLEATGIVERTRNEARLIALAPELLRMLERMVYASEARDEPKYSDGKMYRETKKETYALIDKANGLK